MSEFVREVLSRSVCVLLGHDYPPPTHHPPEPEYFDQVCRRCGMAYGERAGVRDD